MKATLFSALAVLTATAVLFVPALAAQSAGIGMAVQAAPGQYPRQYPGQYPQPYPRGPAARGPGYYGADDYAYSNGFSDGYDKGFDDARDRDRYDPRRHRWYRGGDRGYDGGYRMSRRQYGDIYRQGFLRGYDAGFRDAQRGYRGNFGPGYGGSRPGPYPPRWDRR